MGWPGRRLVVGGALAVLVVAVGAAIASGIKPLSFGSTKRFSVAQSFFSATDTSPVCADLTTLPPGPVLIDSIEIQAAVGLQAFMQVQTRSSVGNGYSGVARIGVQMQTYPISGGDSHGHLSTAVAIRDGDVADAGPGQPNRDAAHPVELCVRDDLNGPSYNAFWTVSGQIGK